jgi:hypothetical protein
MSAIANEITAKKVSVNPYSEETALKPSGSCIINKIRKETYEA